MPLEVDARLVLGDMGADLADRSQFTLDQLQDDLGGEMQAHQPVASFPVDLDGHPVAGPEAMAGFQGVDDLLAGHTRL